MAELQQSMRIWTGNDGKFEVEASYIGLFQNTKVKLRKQGGGMIAVPLDRLCEADVAYIAARSGLSDLASITTGTVLQKPDNPKDVNIPSPTLGISFPGATTQLERMTPPSQSSKTPAVSLSSPSEATVVPVTAMQTLSISSTPAQESYFSPRPHEHTVSSNPPVLSATQIPINHIHAQQKLTSTPMEHSDYPQISQQRPITSSNSLFGQPPPFNHAVYSQEEHLQSIPPSQSIISHPHPGYTHQLSGAQPMVVNSQYPSLSMDDTSRHHLQEQQQTFVMSPPPMSTHISYSHQQNTVLAESQATTETLVLTKIEHSGPQRVRAMRPESVQLLSQRSLSSITEKLIHSPQGQWQPRPQTLAGFPSNVLSNIGKFLDARTRVRIASVCRSFLQAMFRPLVWRHVWFLHQDLYGVDSPTIHAMTQTLKGYQLYHAVYTITLDGSAITADSVVHVLLNFLSLRKLSIKGCWEVHSFPLCGKLMQLATTGQRTPIQLEEIELGKALRRGIDKKESEKKPNAPQSFGQDVDRIRDALEQLAGRPVQIDCYLCEFCHIGASGPMLMCAACGPSHIHKCTNCAPKCDRCSTRICNMPQCRGKSIQITTTKCSQCEKHLSICNQMHNQACIAAMKPCERCKGVYHMQCRSNDGGYISNQCSRCGIVACPKCELTGCAGGCFGQWCRGCLEHMDLAHCKCFVLERKTGGKMRKRNVCKNCRKGCARCNIGGFCTRCLGVHSKQCR